MRGHHPGAAVGAQAVRDTECDACADPEKDVHDLLLERVFPGLGAEVVTSGEWIDQPGPSR